MFDIGFSEIVVVAVVALVVVGPERLPRVARTAGALLGRLQRYVSDVKADINREIQLDELKKMQDEVAAKMREIEHSAQQQVADVKQLAQEANQALSGAAQSASNSADATTSPSPQSSSTPSASAPVAVTAAIPHPTHSAAPAHPYPLTGR